LQQALSTAWLAAQGLLSVKALWCKAQGYSAQVTSSSAPTRWTAHCGPARWVVWGPGARNLRLSDSPRTTD